MFGQHRTSLSYTSQIDRAVGWRDPKVIPDHEKAVHWPKVIKAWKTLIIKALIGAKVVNKEIIVRIV